MGDQLVTALNPAQVQAVELGLTDSIFAREGCRTPIAWVDRKRQLQNMIISFSGDAVQSSLDLIPDQVFLNWPLPAEVGAVKFAAHVSGELAKDTENPCRRLLLRAKRPSGPPRSKVRASKRELVADCRAWTSNWSCLVLCLMPRFSATTLDVVCCCVSLSVVECCCFSLSAVACCCVLLCVVVCCCVSLKVVVECCCVLLYVVVCCCVW